MNIHRRRLAVMGVGAWRVHKTPALLGARIMDQSHEDGPISAFEFDIVREAFRRSIVETKLAEKHWAEHAKNLLQQMADCEPDQSMIDRIIGR